MEQASPSLDVGILTLTLTLILTLTLTLTLALTLPQASPSLDVGIVGLRLSEVVRAYGSEAASKAKETFVMIPLMSEVSTARLTLTLGLT